MCPAVALPPTRPAGGGTPVAASPSADVKPRPSFRLLPCFPDMDHIHRVLTASGFVPSSLLPPPPPPLTKSSACRVCRLRFASEVQVSSHHCSPKQPSRSKPPDPPEHNTETLEPSTANKEVTSPSSWQPSSWQPCSDDLPRSGDPPDPSLDPSPSSTVSTETRTGPPESREAAPEGETEEEKAVRLLYCSLCKVAVNSASQLLAHNSGTKHKTMLEARSGDGAIKSFPRGGVKSKLAAPADSSTGLQNKTFHCEICDVHVNSETQLKQHISSRRHKDRAAGKPAKPKFSPYPPGQRHQSFQSLRLTLQKTQDLTKPLASCLLQRHLSVAAAMASSPAHPLCPASNSALFQSHALPQPLLPAAPGPLSSTQVLFSPY